MRVASGAEALVARVRTKDGGEGFGFTLNDEAAVARDMAAWDALARAKGVPLYGLLGGSYRRTVSITKDELPAIAPDWTALRADILANKHELLRIDPFAWGSLEMVQTIAAVANAFDLSIALLAPNGHIWELQYCAALAATLRGDDTRIIVRTISKEEMKVPEQPGIGVEWSQEEQFNSIQWQS